MSIANRLSTKVRTLPQVARAYNHNVIDHYENPYNVGSLDRNDRTVGTGLVGAPSGGDVMKIQIQVNDDTGMITKAVFKTFGCGSSIASSSLATMWAEGKSIDAMSDLNLDIAKHLNLPQEKLHCSSLAEDAITAAVKDYKQKRDSVVGALDSALWGATKAPRTEATM